MGSTFQSAVMDLATNANEINGFATPLLMLNTLLKRCDNNFFLNFFLELQEIKQLCNIMPQVFETWYVPPQECKDISRLDSLN